VRHFYEGKKVRFDSDGTAVGGKQGIWTIHGYVRVNKVRIKNRLIAIDGERLAAIYDDKQKNMKLASYEEPVRFELPIGTDPSAALLRMFVGMDEDASKLVPDYWKQYAETHYMADLSKASVKPPQRDQPEVEPGVYRVGGSVKPPILIKQVEPEFTQFARQFRITGSTAVRVIVDENGHPTKVSIIRPLGAGLDENAVDAVKKWSFRPGTKDDRPVKTLVTVEVTYSFHP
jgi:TonB family protein